MGVDPSPFPSNLKRLNGLVGSLTTNVKRLPGDVYVSAGYAIFAEPIVTGFVTVPDVVRVAVALPLVLFLPGYVVLSAVYPGTEPHVEETRWLTLTGQGLRWPDRLALSIGTSLALIPLFGLFISGLALGLNEASVGTSLGVFVLLGAVVGGLRRLYRDSADRYTVPLGAAVHDLERALSGGDGLLNIVLNATLILLVAFALTGLLVAFIVPPTGEAYTNFYLLTETDEGTLVASDFPEELTLGESTEIVVGIDNHEAEPTTYTVVAELQRVRVTGTDVELLEREQVGRFQRNVPAGATVQEPTAIQPTFAGEDLRLVYYLYKGAVSEDPDAAYRSVFIWVTVAEG